jgi:hypothetical protein
MGKFQELEKFLNLNYPTIKIKQCIRMAVSGQQVNNKKYSDVNMDLYERVMKDYNLLDSLTVRVDETQKAYL